MIPETMCKNTKDGNKVRKESSMFLLFLHHKPNLFFLFLSLLVRWFPSGGGRTSESAGTKQTSTHKEVFNIRQFLLDLRKQKELAEGIGIEEDDTEDLGNKERSLHEEKTFCYTKGLTLLLRVH